ncbi:TolC family protein [Flavobacterium sp.]|jgi:outer membrane protein TolC|uniref:TolC family protein n=3 Tax=Flavobacterium sp. TaxID=239 RepID=UPI0022CACDCD|nr:TolC family protein [Flavobacterium sp.]MCZ8145219.1 TolC family protein [Flavobacterium sp.]MCZ8367161.1 TolC family protein [Flavobacterium sp.]
MKKAVLFTTLILGNMLGLQAQDTLSISKSGLLEKVTQNLQLKIAQHNYQGAKADYKQTRALFLPSISASQTAMVTTNPLMAFGSKLNQEILTPMDFDPNRLNNPNQTQNFATQIEVQQPLINLDGWMGRKAAKAKMDAYGLQSKRTQEYLQLEVVKAYMQLQLAYKAVAVMQKAEGTATANLKLVDNYFKNGMVQKTDVLNVQVRVNEIKNQLASARSNVQNASDYLAFLLNEDIKGIYKPTETLEASPTEIALIATLNENRSDFQAYQKTTEAYKNMLKMQQMSLLPRLNAFGNYQLYDRKVMGFQANGYLLGAQLSWNLFDGMKSYGKIDKAKAEFQKAETEADQYKKQSQLEFQKAQRQFQDAKSKVSNAQLAWEQSKEAYRIRQNRFAQGLEKTTDVLQSETLMYQKELEYQQSIFEYQFTEQYLQFLNPKP